MKNSYEVYGTNFMPEVVTAAGDGYIRDTADRQILAMAYVPNQKSIEPQYSPEKGFCAGTIFKDLDLPWEGVRYCD